MRHTQIQMDHISHIPRDVFLTIALLLDFYDISALIGALPRRGKELSEYFWKNKIQSDLGVFTYALPSAFGYIEALTIQGGYVAGCQRYLSLNMCLYRACLSLDQWHIQYFLDKGANPSYGFYAGIAHPDPYKGKELRMIFLDYKGVDDPFYGYVLGKYCRNSKDPGSCHFAMVFGYSGWGTSDVERELRPNEEICIPGFGATRFICETRVHHIGKGNSMNSIYTAYESYLFDEPVDNPYRRVSTWKRISVHEDLIYEDDIEKIFKSIDKYFEEIKINTADPKRIEAIQAFFFLCGKGRYRQLIIPKLNGNFKGKFPYRWLAVVYLGYISDGRAISFSAFRKEFGMPPSKYYKCKYPVTIMLYLHLMGYLKIWERAREVYKELPEYEKFDRVANNLNDR